MAMAAEAERAFRAATEVWTRDRDPLVWAHLHVNLANLYADMSVADPDLKDHAATAYRQALEILRPDTAPESCAAAAKSLGDLLAGGEDAYEAYRLALVATDAMLAARLTPVRQRHLLGRLRRIGDRLVSTCARLADRPEYARSGLLHSAWTKSRLFTSRLSLTTLPPPAEVPADVLDAEAALIDKVRDYETELATLTEATRTVAVPSTPHATMALDLPERRRHGRQRLDRLWRQIEHRYPQAREYVALRRGEPLSWLDVANLGRR
jgi:hypothetical protein